MKDPNVDLPAAALAASCNYFREHLEAAGADLELLRRELEHQRDRADVVIDANESISKRNAELHEELTTLRRAIGFLEWDSSKDHRKFVANPQTDGMSPWDWAKLKVSKATALVHDDLNAILDGKEPF